MYVLRTEVVCHLFYRTIGKERKKDIFSKCFHSFVVAQIRKLIAYVPYPIQCHPHRPPNVIPDRRARTNTRPHPDCESACPWRTWTKCPRRHVQIIPEEEVWTVGGAAWPPRRSLCASTKAKGPSTRSSSRTTALQVGRQKKIKFFSGFKFDGNRQI